MPETTQRQQILNEAIAAIRVTGRRIYGPFDAIELLEALRDTPQPADPAPLAAPLELVKIDPSWRDRHAEEVKPAIDALSHNRIASPPAAAPSPPLPAHIWQTNRPANQERRCVNCPVWEFDPAATQACQGAAAPAAEVPAGPTLEQVCKELEAIEAYLDDKGEDFADEARTCTGTGEKTLEMAFMRGLNVTTHVINSIRRLRRELDAQSLPPAPPATLPPTASDVGGDTEKSST